MKFYTFYYMLNTHKRAEKNPFISLVYHCAAAEFFKNIKF